jgi:hypothetical protein
MFFLTGCYSTETTTIYNKSLTSGEASSEPIYLSFQDNKKSSFHFLLKHSLSAENYLLYVRWNTPGKDLIFNGTDTTLKFLVNNSELITLQPIKKPRVTAFNIETKGHQEEGIFELTTDQMRMLSYAKNVEVELTGKYILITGKFNRLSTFKAFKNFFEEG